MSEKESSSYFWVSYTDLMTSLFFIMLVLYVLTLSVLVIQNKKLEVEADELKKIKEIEKATNEIDSNYFRYNEEFKKHVLKIDVKFPSRQSKIEVLNSKETQDQLVDAGRKIINLVEKFNEAGENIPYLVIIEGQASRDSYLRNYELSYERALSLLRLWQGRGVNMNNTKNIELIIAGSGIGGKPRVKPDSSPLNQRFLIHIIPKVGKIIKTED